MFTNIFLPPGSLSGGTVLVKQLFKLVWPNRLLSKVLHITILWSLINVTEVIVNLEVSVRSIYHMPQLVRDHQTDNL